MWGARHWSSSPAAPVGQDRTRPRHALQQRHSAGIEKILKCSSFKRFIDRKTN